MVKYKHTNIIYSEINLRSYDGIYIVALIQLAEEFIDFVENGE